MKALPRHVMTIGDVAEYLDLSETRVRQFDAELAPIRVGRDHARRYDPAEVARFAEARDRQSRAAG